MISNNIYQNYFSNNNIFKKIRKCASSTCKSKNNIEGMCRVHKK